MAKTHVVDEPLSVAVPVADVAVEARVSAIEDAKSVLGRLAAVPGVSLAVLVDREGFLIESAGDLILEAESAGALAGCLAEASEAIGRELGQGALVGLTAEYEAGLILVNRAASAPCSPRCLRSRRARQGAPRREEDAVRSAHVGLRHARNDETWVGRGQPPPPIVLGDRGGELPGVPGPPWLRSSTAGLHLDVPLPWWAGADRAAVALRAPRHRRGAPALGDVAVWRHAFAMDCPPAPRHAHRARSRLAGWAWPFGDHVVVSACTVPELLWVPVLLVPFATC